MTTLRERLEAAYIAHRRAGHPEITSIIALLNSFESALLTLIADARAGERERCAKWHDEHARRAEKYAANIRANWMGDDISEDDRRDNSLDAWKHTQIASDHKRYAAAIRSLGQGDENGPA